MNPYIETQVTNMVMTVQAFSKTCQVAAMKDDGKIDKQEEKQLAKIDKAAKAFIKSLQEIK
jgi:hypothetical protein